MRYRTFGRTGLQVSELVFGGGWVGGLLIHQDDDTKLKALRRAMEAGINWIDTAPSYGQTRSEQALGWLLAEIGGKPHLSTKVRLDTARPHDIAGQVERSIHESLERLRRQSVDVLLLHNPIEPAASGGAVAVDHVLGANGVADALERMREQGLTRHIGFTAPATRRAARASSRAGASTLPRSITTCSTRAPRGRRCPPAGRARISAA